MRRRRERKINRNTDLPWLRPNPYCDTHKYFSSFRRCIRLLSISYTTLIRFLSSFSQLLLRYPWYISFLPLFVRVMLCISVLRCLFTLVICISHCLTVLLSIRSTLINTMYIYQIFFSIFLNYSLRIYSKTLNQNLYYFYLCKYFIDH